MEWAKTIADGIEEVEIVDSDSCNSGTIKIEQITGKRRNRVVLEERFRHRIRVKKILTQYHNTPGIIITVMFD